MRACVALQKTPSQRPPCFPPSLPLPQAQKQGPAHMRGPENSSTSKSFGSRSRTPCLLSSAAPPKSVACSCPPSLPRLRLPSKTSPHTQTLCVCVNGVWKVERGEGGGARTEGKRGKGESRNTPMGWHSIRDVASHRLAHPLLSLVCFQFVPAPTDMHRVESSRFCATPGHQTQGAHTKRAMAYTTTTSKDRWERCPHTGKSREAACTVFGMQI
jgi:hypothetical protein